MSKGVIPHGDDTHMLGASGILTASACNAAPAAMILAVYRVPVPEASPPAAGSTSSAVSADLQEKQQTPPGQTPPQQAPSVSPTTLSAANPVRVFPVGGIPKGDLKPAIKLGPIGLTPYGFLQATSVPDSSSPA